MRVALVGPKWHEMVHSYPSLGLGYLAAIAEQEGHDVAVFDMGLRPKTPVADDVAAIVAWKPDVIAFTSMTTSYRSVEDAVGMLKAAGPAPIIIGGPHATTLPELTLQNPNIDFLVYGKGEYVFRDWLRQIAAGDTNWAANKGLWYHTHIYWDGRIAMCDRDFNLAYDLGNVRSTDGVVRVLENWNGPKMQELRRKHAQGETDGVSPCNTCTEWAWWKPKPFRSHGNYNASKLQGE